jgi:hypothetical protein
LVRFHNNVLLSRGTVVSLQAPAGNLFHYVTSVAQLRTVTQLPTASGRTKGLFWLSAGTIRSGHLLDGFPEILE